MRSHPKAAFAASTHRESGRFPLGVIAAMLVCAAAFLGIGAPAASAAPEAQPTFAPLTTFESETIASVPLPSGGTIALDSNGNIFVADELSERVHIFAPDAALGGTPLTTALSAGSYPSDIAVDRATDDLYVQESGAFTSSPSVKRYTSDGNTPPTYTVDPGFNVPPGQPEPNSFIPAGQQIAVDPTTHDLLVADAGAEAIRRYDTSGTLVATISTPGEHPTLLAVAADGTLFFTSGSDILHWSGTGLPLGEIQNVGQVRAMAIDPTNGNLVLSVGVIFPPNTTATFLLAVYSPTGSLLSRNLSTGIPADTNGLVIDGSSGRLYAVAINEVSAVPHPVHTLVPAVQPGVEPPTFSNVTSTGLHLEAEVDPGEEGGGIPAGSAIAFEYRPAGSSEAWLSTPSQEVNAPGAYGADLDGLEPNLAYEARAVASNSLISFTTAATEAVTSVVEPGVETNSATDVTETEAVLNGKINPFGLPTTYYFEYGTTTAYGSRIPAGIEAVAGAGHGFKAFGRTIFGLTPGTTYHYRLVATNSVGTTEGPDRTLTTAGVGGVLHRAYEQVTPAFKNGANVYRRIGFQASIDGNAFAYVSQVNSDSAPVFARSISVRGSSDWSGRQDVDPPAKLGGGVRDHETLAISDDFTHALVASNVALTPGAVEGAANLYLEDIASRTYRLVGVSEAPFAYSLITGIQTSGLVQAGSPDFSWVVFGSPVPMLPGAPINAVYRWSEADGLEVESVLPNGEPSQAVRATYSSVYQPASADGSRIYYTAIRGAEEGVFMREGGGPPKAVAVSTVPASQPPVLLGVNKDGRYAFLFSEQKLTGDAPDPEPERERLYRYDASDGSIEYLGVNGPTHINVRDENGGGPKMQYGSFGISDSGDTIYFRGDEGTGLGDLKVWRNGVVHTAVPGGVLWSYEHASPNGRYYVYNQGGGDQGPVYLYDAETDETSCVSCLADGTPVAATVPAPGDSSLGYRRPRAVDDSGTVYFDTAARLVAKDVNGLQDVYSYRDGQATLISPGNAPYTAYISDVSPDGRNVFFTTAQKLVGRDNDEEIDVYDARVDGGLPAQSPPPPQECVRDDCKGTPNAGPELPFGGSEALSGPENVKPAKQKKCGKGKRAKRVKGNVRCVKKHAAHKHKPNKSKKGGNR